MGHLLDWAALPRRAPWLRFGWGGLVHTVADLLEVRKSEPVRWIAPLASVYDALKMMNDENVGALLVQIDQTQQTVASHRNY